MRISDWSSDVCSSDLDIWREWLQLHYPERAAHVMSLIRQMRGGKDYDAQFGRRMRGEGPFADLIAARFANAHRRLGFGRMPALDTTQFKIGRASCRERGCQYV